MKPQQESLMNGQGEENPVSIRPSSSDVPLNEPSDLLYTVDQNPPWYIALGLGFQHYVTMFGSVVGIPFILSEPLCYKDNPVVLSQLISTIFFTSGISTLLQTTFGVRLPIVQGGTYSLIAPTISIMNARGKCPSSNVGNIPVTNLTVAAFHNATSIPGIITGDEEEWKLRMREVQGAIAVASLFEIVIGFSGLMGHLVKFIGPLTIVPTITLITLPLFEITYSFAETQWGISILIVLLITLFSQVVHNVNVPVPTWRDGRLKKGKLQIFKLFPVILPIAIVWLLCAILTESGVFTNDPDNLQYRARTDARAGVVQQSPWFFIPYPGQWGTPIVSSAAVISMLAGFFASMIESIGDYYACAQLSGAPPPPVHAINRGLGIEGIGNCFAGLIGTGNGTTSYSQNVGAIGITKVGSRRVVQVSGFIMIILAIIGKFGGMFAAIPDPVLGGIFAVTFGIIVGIGLSMLQFVDLKSMRNVFVLGVSLFWGMVIPFYFRSKPDSINTGVGELDQILRILLGTHMAIGGGLGFILDNTLPGSLEERGLIKWRHQQDDKTISSNLKNTATIHCYDIPFVTNYFQKFRFTKYVPFLPYYDSNESSNLQDTQQGQQDTLL